MYVLRFLGLLPLLESTEFVQMQIQSPAKHLPDLFLEPLHWNESGTLFRWSEKESVKTQMLNASEVLTNLDLAFNQGYSLAVCLTEKERIVYTQTPKGVKIETESLQEYRTREGQHHFDVKYMTQTPRIRSLLIELGILTFEGNIKREQYGKLVEIKNFIEVIDKILLSFKKNKPLTIVDAACGKSYLSFLLCYFLCEEWGRDATFLCIDTNVQLIERCQEIQNKLNFSQMQFFTRSIRDFTLDNERVNTFNVDILYSLHGCDTATDEAIAAGVLLNSQAIIVVPCCHFEIRGQLRHHSLKGITRYGLFEEKFAALLTDSLRALALEVMGYDVATFRFVTDDISPKNALLRALKRQYPNQQAWQQYQDLRDQFGVSPMIGRLLQLDPAKK